MNDERPLLQRTIEVIDPLPGADGGVAVTVSTASSPPAVAMLSSGDILISGDRVRLGIHASSSVVARLGGAFTLLVPLGDSAARVECVDAGSEVDGALAMIEGTIADVRETGEPPWRLEMSFSAAGADAGIVSAFVEYWSEVRSWLDGQRTNAPDPPA